LSNVFDRTFLALYDNQKPNIRYLLKLPVFQKTGTNVDGTRALNLRVVGAQILSPYNMLTQFKGFLVGDERLGSQAGENSGNVN
jgi:hypothetical protein